MKGLEYFTFDKKYIYVFQEPSPAHPWLGIYNATTEPPKCIQLNYWKITDKVNEIIGAEYCLYINVYTPKVNLIIKNDYAFYKLCFIKILFLNYPFPSCLLVDRMIIFWMS